LYAIRTAHPGYGPALAIDSYSRREGQMNEARYRSMTPNQLRRQYNPSCSIPEAPRIFQSWKDRSLEFRGRAKAKLDIS